MSLSQVLIEYKRGIRERTLKLLEKVPAEKLNWRPTAGVLAVGQLIHHIGQGEMAWTRVLRGEWGLKTFMEMRLGMDLEAVIGDIEDLDEERAALEIAHQELLHWVAGQSDADLEKTYQAPGWNPTARDIVLLLCEHEVHHRGQIVTYLRILGVEDSRPWGF